MPSEIFVFSRCLDVVITMSAIGKTTSYLVACAHACANVRVFVEGGGAVVCRPVWFISPNQCIDYLICDTNSEIFTLA